MNFLHDYTEAGAQKLAEALIRAPAQLTSLLRRFGVPTVALHAPVGIDRRGARVVIKTTDRETARIQLPLPFACNVVGLYCVAKPVAKGAFALDLDDIEIALDVESTRRMTGQKSTDSPNDAGLTTFAPLGSVHASGSSPSLLMLRLEHSAPNFGFTLRSRYATTGGSGLPGDVLVSVHAIVSPLPGAC